MAEAIRQAKRPILYIGGGCVDSGAHLRLVAAALGCWAAGLLRAARGLGRATPATAAAAATRKACRRGARRHRALLQLTPAPLSPAPPPPTAAEVKELVERTGIPVAQTLMALGAFPEQDPLSLQVGWCAWGGCCWWGSSWVLLAGLFLGAAGGVLVGCW